MGQMKMQDIYCMQDCPIVLSTHIPSNLTLTFCDCMVMYYISPEKELNGDIPVCDHGYYVCKKCFPASCDYLRNWKREPENKEAKVGAIKWV